VTVHHGVSAGCRALVELYRTADVFCLPTRGDCLPMVLAEAGAAGLPLVSTAIAGIPEIVREGETGLLVPPDDVTALGRALRALIEAPQLRRRLGDGARALVGREHDAATNASTLVELLAAIGTRDRMSA